MTTRKSGKSSHNTKRGKIRECNQARGTIRRQIHQETLGIRRKGGKKGQNGLRQGLPKGTQQPVLPVQWQSHNDKLAVTRSCNYGVVRDAEPINKPEHSPRWKIFQNLPFLLCFNTLSSPATQVRNVFFVRCANRSCQQRQYPSSLFFCFQCWAWNQGY